MNFLLQSLLGRARSETRRILLPEAPDDLRVRLAAEIVATENLARPVLPGTPALYRSLWPRYEELVDKVDLIDPAEPALEEALVRLYQARRRKEGRSDSEVAEMIRNDRILSGAGLVALGHADGMVAGARTATADVIRSGIKMVGLREGIATLSSFFLMILPDRSTLGNEVYLVFADCGVVPQPTVQQLADIAEASTLEVRSLIPDFEPQIAFLSFSTRGSAIHENVDHVREAVAVLRERRPDWIIDGEMQVDAALIPEVRRLKAPDSPLHGNANVLVFPDLNSGNIGYKLVQRLAGAEALGPFLSGLRMPINDLSRGASAEEIAYVAALTGLQAR